MSQFERLSLLYSDGSFGVLAEGTTVEKALDEVAFCDLNEKRPEHLTKLVIVRIEIIETVPLAAETASCPKCGKAH